MVALIEIDGRYIIPDKKKFLITSVDDLAMLPTSKQPGTEINSTCAPGSVAYTPDLTCVAILGNDDVWHEVVWENT